MQVHVVDAMARFGAVSSSALDTYFAILQQRDSILVRALAQAVLPNAAPAASAQRLDSLRAPADPQPIPC